MASSQMAGFFEPEGTLASGEFTIEITHTEMIEGQEYFVFSDIEYDWPPVPNLFLADQKVSPTRVLYCFAGTRHPFNRDSDWLT